MNNRSEAYNLDLFAPQRAPENPNKKENVPQPKLMRSPRLSREYQRQESRAVTVKTFKVLMCAIAVLFFLGSYLLASARLDEINHDIAAVEADIKIATSENTRLKMELGALASLDKVDEYAVTKLGMVKAESYQEDYIELPATDKIVLAGGKDASQSVPKDDALHKLLSYLG